jgi:hypothetical protein
MMTDCFPPAKQRPQLTELRAAIDARASSLRRDEYGDWAIFGKLGHIYAAPEGFHLMISTGESARRWVHVKTRLAFCRLTQDGDDEGCVILDRLPVKSEAGIIRKALGIPKAQHLTAEQVASIRKRNAAQGRFQPGFSAKPTQAATLVAVAPESAVFRAKGGFVLAYGVDRFPSPMFAIEGGRRR